MPTKKPRMALTLPDDVHAALFSLADAMEKPAASVVSELLQEMVPQLEGLAKVIRASKAGKRDAARLALQHMMGDSFAQVMADQQPDMFGKGKGKR